MLDIIISGLTDAAELTDAIDAKIFGLYLFSGKLD